MHIYSPESYCIIGKAVLVPTRKDTRHACEENKNLLTLPAMELYFLYHPSRHYTNRAAAHQKT
jgi:hypothetical protein